MWFLFGLLKLFTYLPMKWSLVLGSQTGWLIYQFASSRRRIARKNIKQAFPDYTDKQIKQLNLSCFRSLGMSIFETGYAWFGKTEKLKTHCTIEGQQHLDAAMQKGKGAILLTGHFTTLDIGARMIGFNRRTL